MFNRSRFNNAIDVVARRYEQSAPDVSSWCNRLAYSFDDAITLADVELVEQLFSHPIAPEVAATLLAKHQNAVGCQSVVKV